MAAERSLEQGCVLAPLQAGNTMYQVVVSTKCGKRGVNAEMHYAQNNAYKHHISSSPSSMNHANNEKIEFGMKPGTLPKIN